MKKKIIRLLSISLILVMVLGVSALAGTASSTKNGISLDIAASAASKGAGTYALCNKATKVYTWVYAYNTAGTMTPGSGSGTTDAMASAYVSGTPDYATGSCTATISGSSKVGPTLTVNFS